MLLPFCIFQAAHFSRSKRHFKSSIKCLFKQVVKWSKTYMDHLFCPVCYFLQVGLCRNTLKWWFFFNWWKLSPMQVSFIAMETIDYQGIWKCLHCWILDGSRLLTYRSPRGKRDSFREKKVIRIIWKLGNKLLISN